MTPDQAIASMRSPRDMAIICIDVTNRCDLQCSNCTRLLAQQRRKWDMTLDNFRLALRSLAGFDGVIAMIGGNPCIHPQFPELCRIFAEEVPEQRQRGLWSNNVFKHQDIIAQTFGCYNLNPHGDARGVKSIQELRKRLPNLPFYEGHSYHAPLMTAIQDLVPDKERMWDAIAGCDINKNWSASIVQNNGVLRAYFCEVAASFDLARGEDHGYPVYPGWWQQHISAFTDQVRHFCPGCGVAARLAGRLDSEDTDDYTASNADIATNTRGKRKVVELTEAVKSTTAVTDYSEEHHVRAAIKDAGKISISVIIPAYNATATIRETIESVVEQPVADNIIVEVIVCDDCSTDDTRKHCLQQMALVEKRVHIRLLPAAKNAGPAAARNRGLKASRSDYVMFLDADDVLAPGMIWVGLETLSRHPELAAVITDVELINAHREVHPAQLNAMIWSMPSNMIVRRSVADLLDGFPEDAVYRGPHATEDMVFKQALVGLFRIGWIKYPFLKYRVHPGSHFDVFLDTTTVVDGELQYTRDSDDALDVATAIYIQRAKMRVDEIGASKEDGEAHVVMIDISRREHS